MRERELAGRAFQLTKCGFDGRTQLVQATMERLGGSVQNGSRQRVKSAKVRLQWGSGRFGNVLATLGHNSLLPFRGGCAPAPSEMFPDPPHHIPGGRWRAASGRSGCLARPARGPRSRFLTCSGFLSIS